MSEPRLHVTFNSSAAGTLRQALEAAQRPDHVLCPMDNFSFGPIATDSAEDRIRWVEEVLGYTGWEDCTATSGCFLAAFDSDTSLVTAWISRHQTDCYAGFLWWLSHIGDRPISVIEIAELSLTSPGGMITHLDKATPLSPDERRRYQCLWDRLKTENAPLRVIDGDQLVSAPIDYFDDVLLGRATDEWQKMARIVGFALVEFAEAGIYQVCDLVLGARLADLAEAGMLDWQGDLTNMRRCELRLPVAKT